MKVLYLEDSDLDAELIGSRLKRSGLPLEVHRVPDRGGFSAELEKTRYDLVLSDYQVPGFKGLEALELSRKHQPLTPFIFVSGAMGEELAIEALKQGATDYVLKHSLGRLAPSIERALAEAQARAARREAEMQLREADRRKDEFLATLAHELRNPLAPLLNGLHMLRRSAPGDAQFNWARDMMERQLVHMVRLVDDLLDVSRITRGHIELRRQVIDIQQVLQGALEVSRPIIDASRHRLTVSNPDVPFTVDADPTRLAQVVSNLLNNAAKYTPDGGHIELAARREGDAAVITIRDTGLGIAPDKLERVFDLFTQLSDGSERAQGGLGIGLALVRRLVEMHGGTVTASSDGAGKGSTFTVRLPVSAGSYSR